MRKRGILLALAASLSVVLVAGLPASASSSPLAA